MAKQKKGSDKSNADRNQPQTKTRMGPLRSGLTILCLVVAVSISFKGYLETRVNSRFDKEKMVEKSGLEIPGRYWGSYRPGLYFGMKTRDPYSLVAGLMWYFPDYFGIDGFGIRHWCEQGDKPGHFTWTEHDGRNFGVQVIHDGPFRLETSFVKRLGGDYGGDWTLRVSVKHQNESLTGRVSLIFYAALDEKTDGWIQPIMDTPGIIGKTSGLGNFKFNVHHQEGETVMVSYLSTVISSLRFLKEYLFAGMLTKKGLENGKKVYRLVGDMVHTADGQKLEPNFIAIQMTAQIPTEMEFVFESDSYLDRPDTLIGKNFQRELEKHRSQFHKKFENVYKLREKKFDEDQISFAKSVLSNLVGGIGYFYGSSRVQSAHTKSPVPYWKAPLYTAVPSRSFFPRGFLWDEGFHGLVLSTWDLEIELDIIRHWFDLMNVEGWIPREQILGQEALARVPEEFVTQHNSHANPPAFFLTIDFILRNFGEELVRDNGLRFLDNLYPRLQAWFDWFNVSQVGTVPGSYRWKGRDPDAIKEINPKTLASGLDDYPRASHVTDEERHVDLRCWIALAASTAAQISGILDRHATGYRNTYEYLTDPKLLKKLHWSEKAKRFADYGLHTDMVTLKRPPTSHPSAPQDKVRVVLKDPVYRLVDTTFGYVSIFPFLLQQLDKDSPELGQILKDLDDPQLLWTNYGLRSLSKTSPLYMKYNTEHDPPYWRGPIWININYLAVKALHHYSREGGVHSARAANLYERLRKNLINNIYREYKRSGYVWEQYNDETGRGQGSRPFTGWSSLVVLLMGEIY
ncbi:UNVERIFIED_CONTAM: hypothetical protein PYX00_007370 [Menopon gallinae]|uniref:Mannosyl-oligosaccharide glucosidase n=1 Tax=Menopon gallinae TaxID=328185 RepID=A0AAW2HIT3_9NEOP